MAAIVAVLVAAVFVVAVVVAAAAHGLRYIDPFHLFHFLRKNL